MAAPSPCSSETGMETNTQATLSTRRVRTERDSEAPANSRKRRPNSQTALILLLHPGADRKMQQKEFALCGTADGGPHSRLGSAWSAAATETRAETSPS